MVSVALLVSLTFTASSVKGGTTGPGFVAVSMHHTDADSMNSMGISPSIKGDAIPTPLVQALLHLAPASMNIVDTKGRGVAANLTATAHPSSWGPSTHGVRALPYFLSGVRRLLSIVARGGCIPCGIITRAMAISPLNMDMSALVLVIDSSAHLWRNRERCCY